MKKLFLFHLLAFYSLKSFSQSCIPASSVYAGPDVCNTSCVNLSATYTGGVRSTTTYTSEKIDYAAIDSAGTQVNGYGSVNFDDVWSPKIPIGFSFCYYGNTYTELQVGVNGQLHFGTTVSTDPNGDLWEINTNLPNNTDLPGNTICAVFRDIDPSKIQAPATRVRTEGSAPCRRMYITWYNTPLFKNFDQPTFCTQQPAPADQAFQAILYEGSNIIEVHIKKSTSLACWNDGRGIVGIQNENATEAVVVKPMGNWNVGNGVIPSEAWRFTPNGPVLPPTYTWTGPGGVVGTGTTVNVCPTVTTTYTVTANFPYCGGATTSATDQVKVTVPNAQFTGKTTFCGGEPITFDGSASTDIPNAYWEILESDQNGWYVPGGYAWNTWTGSAPGVFTFPSNVPCGKYYKIKLAGSACWKDMNKVIYVACNCACGTSFTNPCDLGTICSTDVNGIDNSQSYYSNNFNTGTGQASKDVWYKFIPQSDGNFEISTCGSSIDTYIHLLDQNGVEIAYNDDQNTGGWINTSCSSGGLISMMNSKNTGKQNTPMRLFADKTYYVVVEGYGYNQGLINLQIRACLPCVSSGDGSSADNAIDLCLLGCHTSSYSITRNNGDAIFTNSYGTDKTAGQPSKDVWYTFTVQPGTFGLSWNITTVGSSFNNAYIHVLAADRTHIVSSNTPYTGSGSSYSGISGNQSNISLNQGTYYIVTEGTGTAEGTIEITIHNCFGRPTTDVEENSTDELSLQVFPNPFSTSTTIKIFGAQKEQVRLEILNVSGACVYKNENQMAGEEITLGEDFPAGVYFVKMNAGNEIKTEKVIKLK